MKKGLSSKAQVTIFIIIAIVIVAALILVLNSKVRNSIKDVFVPSSPEIKLQQCIEKDLQNAVVEISNNGGSVNPVNYYPYKGMNVEYLCYTNQYYQTCTMQQPMLKEHVEREILVSLKPKIDGCVNNLKQDLRDKGYSVTDSKQVNSIDLTPGKVSLVVSGINAVKDDNSVKYNSFSAEDSSKMYNLLMLANSILNYEARYGDADTTAYMLYYPGVKVEKLKQSYGSKIYILTQENEKFMFATRSLSWPGGLNTGEVYTPEK